MHRKVDRAAAGNRTRHLEQLRRRPRAARPHWTLHSPLLVKLCATPPLRTDARSRFGRELERVLERLAILRLVVGSSGMTIELGPSLGFAQRFVASGPNQVREARRSGARVVQKLWSTQYSGTHQTLCTEGASTM